MALEIKTIIDDALEKKIKLLGKLKGDRAGDIDVEKLLCSVLNELIDDLIKEELEAAGVNLGRQTSHPTTYNFQQESKAEDSIVRTAPTKTQMIPDMDHDLSGDAEEAEEEMEEPTEEALLAVEKIARGELAPAPTKVRAAPKAAAPKKPVAKKAAAPQFTEEQEEAGEDDNVPNFFDAVASDIPIEDIETDPEAYMEEVANGPIQKAHAPKKKNALGRGMSALLPNPDGPAHTKATDRFTRPRVTVRHATIDN